jgi:hypothetical protein
MMATLIRSATRPEFVRPANRESFTLAELQHLVGGSITVLESKLLLADTREPLLMVVNEDGELLQLPINKFASQLVDAGVIVGDVVLCNRAELGETALDVYNLREEPKRVN